MKGALIMSALLLGALALPTSAEANWGPYGNCGVRAEPNEHCYSLAEHDGSALASIAFINTTEVSVPSGASGGFVTNEQWISFNGLGDSWIETGQVSGIEEPDVEHPFYAQRYPHRPYEEVTSPQEVLLDNYNHYVLFDANGNGVWHIYWGCCEVGYYAGWPLALNVQQAGVEAADTAWPTNWGEDEVAWSDGGSWYPWSPASYLREPGICEERNWSSPAEGNIRWAFNPNGQCR